jgi:hypothetical protein
MALTDIGLCARALIKLGAKPINGFDDGTAEAEVAGALYGPVRDGLLTTHPWSFASDQVTLAQLADAPLADYAYAYALPANFLRALSAGSGARGRGLAYRIAGSALHCDAPAVVLSYLRRPPELDFPPFFDMALIARLAAEFCLPLTESASRAELLARIAEDELRRARTVDSQQDTPPRLEDFTLIEARR